MPRIIDPVASGRVGPGIGQIPLSAFPDYSMAGLGRGIEGGAAAIADAVKTAAQMKLEDRLADKRGQWEMRLAQQRSASEERMQERRLASEERLMRDRMAHDERRDKFKFGADLAAAAIALGGKLDELMLADQLAERRDVRQFRRELLGKIFEAMEQGEQAVAAEEARGKGALSEAQKIGWSEAKKAYTSIMEELGTPSAALEWFKARRSTWSAPLTNLMNPTEMVMDHDSFEAALQGRLSQAFAEIERTNLPAEAKNGLKAQIVQELRGVFQSGEMLTETAAGTPFAGPFAGGPLRDWYIGALDKAVAAHRKNRPDFDPEKPFNFTDAIAQQALKRLDVSQLTQDARARVKDALDYKQAQVIERLGRVDPRLADQLRGQRGLDTPEALKGLQDRSNLLLRFAGELMGVDAGMLLSRPSQTVASPVPVLPEETSPAAPSTPTAPTGAPAPAVQEPAPMGPAINTLERIPPWEVGPQSALPSEVVGAILGALG